MIDLATIWALLPPVRTPDAKVPQVVAFTCDGNRRWAKRLGKLASFGHDQGLIRCREVAQTAFDCGVRHVVMWVASYSNLMDREHDEAVHLVNLMKQELRHRIAGPDRDQAKLRFIGHWRQTKWADAELLALVDQGERLTAHWTERQLTFLFGYDFRRSMATAITALMSSCPNFGSLPWPEQEAAITNSLPEGFIGNVDFSVRTGTDGDPHSSKSFLGWNIWDAQLLFLKRRWPAFGPRQLRQALADYSARERRGGR